MTQNLDALERLAREAKELAEAATPGPWERRAFRHGTGACYVLADIGNVDDLLIADCPDRRNTELIAASRALVPSLADAVLRLVAVARAAETMRESRWLCAPNHDPEGCPGCMMNVALTALAKSEGGG